MSARSQVDRLENFRIRDPLNSVGAIVDEHEAARLHPAAPDFTVPPETLASITLRHIWLPALFSRPLNQVPTAHTHCETRDARVSPKSSMKCRHIRSENNFPVW